MVAGDRNGLQIFPAQHGPHAGASGGPLPADHSGIAHQVFPGGADAHGAELGWGALFRSQGLGQPFLALGDPGAPEAAGAAEGEAVVLNLQPGVLFAAALENQGVVPGLFQVIAKGAAAVGGSEKAGLGGEGGQVEPAGAGCPGAGEGASGDDHQIFLRQGFLLPGQIVVEDLGSHDLAAEVELPLPVAPGIFADGLSRQVHQHDLAHIAAVGSRHGHSSVSVSL